MQAFEHRQHQRHVSPVLDSPITSHAPREAQYTSNEKVEHFIKRSFALSNLAHGSPPGLIVPPTKTQQLQGYGLPGSLHLNVTQLSGVTVSVVAVTIVIQLRHPFPGSLHRRPLGNHRAGECQLAAILKINFSSVSKIHEM